MYSPILNGVLGVNISLLLALNALLCIVGLTKSRQVRLIVLHAGMQVVKVHAVFPSQMGLNCTSQR
jgi:hypothetical protein